MLMSQILANILESIISVVYIILLLHDFVLKLNSYTESVNMYHVFASTYYETQVRERKK